MLSAKEYWYCLLSFTHVREREALSIPDSVKYQILPNLVKEEKIVPFTEFSWTGVQIALQKTAQSAQSTPRLQPSSHYTC